MKLFHHMMDTLKIFRIEIVWIHAGHNLMQHIDPVFNVAELIGRIVYSFPHYTSPLFSILPLFSSSINRTAPAPEETDTSLLFSGNAAENLSIKSNVKTRTGDFNV